MSADNQDSHIATTELAALLERVRKGELANGDLLMIERVMVLFLKLTMMIDKKRTTIKQLRLFLFGDGKKRQSTSSKVDAEVSTEEASKSSATEPKPGKPGHGRKSASACTGAKVVHCQDDELQSGCPCPDKLCQGHLYRFNRIAPFIRYEGQPLIGATRYDQEVLRCSKCTTLYTAPLPADVPPQKYDATADVAIAMSKYGSGLPFHRLAKLQAKFGIPLPASVQWERVLCVAQALLPIFLYLRLLAARASVVYFDDTRIKIINCQPSKSDKRKGIRTTGIMADLDSHKIALYVSGRNHAGDNLSDLLKNRPLELGIIIRMCDALKLNFTDSGKAIISICLQHGRRKFVDLKEMHSEDCQPVIDVIGQVYINEARTKGLKPEERLLYHQLYSGPLIEALKDWIEQRFEQRIVEPNSAVGSAYNYLFNHWTGLTEWLRTAKAPLDNNAAERILKLVVLHRKNAGYFRSEMGATASDVIMSLLESCKLNGIEPFSYMVAVMRNEQAVKDNPAEWLPWNYTKQLKKKVA